METKKIPMLAQPDIRLNNMHRLFPESGEVRKKHEGKTVRVGQRMSLGLPIQNDLLLVQPCIFYNQLGTAAMQIGKQSRDQCWGSRLDPMLDPFLKLGKEFAH